MLFILLLLFANLGWSQCNACSLSLDWGGCTCGSWTEECNPRAGNCGTSFCSGACEPSWRALSLLGVSGLCFVLLVLSLVFLRCWRLEKQRREGGFVRLHSSDSLADSAASSTAVQ